MGNNAYLRGKQISSTASLAASFNTDAFSIPRKITNIGINIDCNNVTDNTGDFNIQHRINDGKNQSEWATLSFSSVPTLANAAATFFVNLNQIPPGDIRVVFTAAGSVPDGDCDIWICGQEI